MPESARISKRCGSSEPPRSPGRGALRRKRVAAISPNTRCARLVAEAHGWRAYFSTDPTLAATTILEQIAARSVLEQDFHDLKEVEGTGQQQVRNVWANVGAFHLTLWAHCLMELWAWFQPQEALCDRSASPGCPVCPCKLPMLLWLAARSLWEAMTSGLASASL